MTDTSVKVFQSTDAGAGGVTGQAGSLIAMILDKCLVNGYGDVTLDSLVVSGNVATGTKNAHGFTAVTDPNDSSKQVHPVIRIAGVTTPAGLNGDWRVTITSATTFTFATTGIADQTATGTITAKRAPAGFSKVFSGTNKAAYRADDPVGARRYLRVDDTTTTYAAVRGYEGMDDVDTASAGALLFPVAGTYWYVIKSTTANSTARDWRLVADGRLFYLFIRAATDSYWDNSTFGDIQSVKAGDVFQSFLCAHITSSSYGNSVLHVLNTASNAVLARSHTQIGGAVVVARYSCGNLGNMGAGGMTANNPADNGFWAAPIDIWEGSTVLRGRLPGAYNPLHAAYPSDRTLITSVPELSGRTLFIQNLVSTSRIALDITGPWR
jgi:hypothetical protein